MILNCQRCNVEFEAKAHNSKFCSDRCGTAWRNERKFDGKVEGYDYIVCPDPTCRQKVSEISKLHAQMHGFESPTAMAAHYGLPTLKCERIRERMKGAGNPGYQHGGKLSPWSRKNPKLTEEKLAEYKEKTKRNRKGTRPNEIQSWIDKGYSEEEARELVRERQRTNSVEKIAQRKGISLEEAQEIRNDITEKWFDGLVKSGMFSGSSKVSTELFDELAKTFPTLMYGSKNEKKIRLKDKVVRVDCYLPDTNKIIEFYGDYWHANPKLYEAKSVIKSGKKAYTAEEKWESDATRTAQLIEKGYDVLIIWESDFRGSREETIEKALSFLKG